MAGEFKNIFESLHKLDSARKEVGKSLCELRATVGTKAFDSYVQEIFVKELGIARCMIDFWMSEYESSERSKYGT